MKTNEEMDLDDTTLYHCLDCNNLSDFCTCEDVQPEDMI